MNHTCYNCKTKFTDRRPVKKYCTKECYLQATKNGINAQITDYKNKLYKK